MERLCRLLEMNGQDISGPQTWMALEQKLYPNILREVQVKKATVLSSNRPWNTAEFRKALKECIEKEELVQVIISKNQDERKKPQIENKPKIFEKGEKDIPKTSTFATNSKFGKKLDPKPEKFSKNLQTRKKDFELNQPKLPKYNCVFCDQKGHWPDKCEKFPTANSRKAKLAEKGFCSKCYNSGHSSEFCTRKIRPCFHCKGNHLAALCEEKFGNKNARESTNAVTEVVSCQINTKGKNQRVLLSREVTVFNPDNPKKRVKTVLGLTACLHILICAKV